MASSPPQGSDEGFQQLPDESTSTSTPSSSHSQDRPRSSSISQSFASEDSQTVILNHPSHLGTASSSNEKEKAIPPKTEGIVDGSEAEPAKCWICFADETEDNPTSSEWRSPCPCALKAHESCLLEWVAGMDKQTRVPGQHIRCPQCKGQIQTTEPYQPFLSIMTLMEHTAKGYAIPLLGTTLAGTVMSGLWLHGFTTVYLIFGAEDADKIFGLDVDGHGIDTFRGSTVAIIPAALIATQWPKFELFVPIASVFSILDLYHKPRNFMHWPPDEAITVAALPFARILYNALYNRYLRPLELQWDKEVGKKDDDEQHVAGGHNINDAAAALELGVAVEQDGVPNDQARRQPPNLQPQAQGGGENVAAGFEGGAVLHDTIDVNHVSEVAMSVLLFPVFSVGAGHLLKWILPRSLTAPLGRFSHHPTGFFQTQFGRTIGGGCLIVFLKDALRLYMKYQYAQTRRQRRILNYEQDSS